MIWKLACSCKHPQLVAMSEIEWGVIMQDVTILIDGEVVVKNAKDGSYEINVN